MSNPEKLGQKALDKQVKSFGRIKRIKLGDAKMSENAGTVEKTQGARHRDGKKKRGGG